jgi:hypothetical protein
MAEALQHVLKILISFWQNFSNITFYPWGNNHKTGKMLLISSLVIVPLEIARKTELFLCTVLTAVLLLIQACLQNVKK